MNHLLATIHVLGLGVADRVRARTEPDERGNITLEQVLWAAAVSAIIIVVVGIIRTFVIDEANKIQSGT